MKKITPTTTTLYLVDMRNPSGRSQVLEELVTAGGATNLSAAYTYGCSLISQRRPGVATNFYGMDGRKSVRLLLNASGSVANTYTYKGVSKGVSPRNVTFRD